MRSLNDSKLISNNDTDVLDDMDVSSTDEDTDSEYEDFEQQQGTRVRKRKADLCKKLFFTQKLKKKF